MKKVLVLNSVKCLACNSVLTSTHRHHFATCGCSNETFTDGGLAYQRIGAVDLDLVENLAVYEELTEQQLEDRITVQQKAAEEKLKAQIESGDVVRFAGKWWTKEVFALLFDSKVQGDKV